MKTSEIITVKNSKNRKKKKRPILQASSTSGRILTVLLALVATTAGVIGWTMTLPSRRGLDRRHPWQQAQQQQQMPMRTMMSSIGPPITAAFAASDKSFHHPKNPKESKVNKRSFIYSEKLAEAQMWVWLWCKTVSTRVPLTPSVFVMVCAKVGGYNHFRHFSPFHLECIVGVLLSCIFYVYFLLFSLYFHVIFRIEDVSCSRVRI